jgi:amidophosphoribosyltransferase
MSDTITVMEKIGHFLDDEVQTIFDRYKDRGHSNKEITDYIIKELSVRRILSRAAKDFDGGYAMAGVFGHGDAFVLRDPNGIRPAYYYQDDELVVVASERPAIQTTFNVPFESIHEVLPGHAIVIKKDGRVKHDLVRDPGEKKSCSFERIYFSRGNDQAIYHERKELGRLLATPVMGLLGNDLVNTVFSYVPNTAATSFYGLIDGIHEIRRDLQAEALSKIDVKNEPERVKEILSWRPRREKILVKDVKMRTFITNDSDRDDLVGHVYDITYGVVKSWNDTLVIMDDSVVRGTTLKRSILRILDRLEPKRIILVSSAPQIRYPDCYGIDMSKMGDFAAFAAAVELLKDKGMASLLDKTYEAAKVELSKPASEQRCVVQDIYAPLTDAEVSKKIAEMLKPKDLRAEFDILFQSVENLHEACPGDRGDWYFTGNYPTPGGNQVANRAFVNYIEGRKERAY